ncbi:ABC transporter ATP-binding protein [Ignicoccus pacificus DSM 13166]|uniref:ABC transporter ATP-binding protein n=1 Tax=Ignicoccus pacificus DSM 13166 TaxID=940294 RepID=A0A977PJT9_9CREN|nr:ABC transporter ATP-binding protein [Ignicoccus pacificus DSM 13166]
MEYAIVAENLVKRFGPIVAVNGVTFKVKKGERFGFLGPNGAGKTTTVHILTTLLKPDEGKALVAGHDVVKEAREVRKKIGVVFQDPALDTHLTAYENLYIHGRLYGLRGKELKERIEEVLKFFDLYEHKDRVVRFFSGGMRRRLEIARALMHRPEVLFLDEPTVGLDPQSRAKVWDYIRGVNEEFGITVFLTTHYMDEADRLCHRIAIIDRGKIIAEGSPDELKRMIGKEIIYVKTEIEPKCPEDFECEKKDNLLIIKVENAARALPKVMELLTPYKILEVNVKRPTLDDVFLELTGRELREEGADTFGIFRAAARRWM